MTTRRPLPLSGCASLAQDSWNGHRDRGLGRARRVEGRRAAPVGLGQLRRRQVQRLCVAVHSTERRKRGGDQDPGVDLRDQVPQVLGHRHRLEGAGTSPAGVAARHPQPREQDRGQHSRNLADDFAPVASAPPGHQHQPVHVGVPAGHSLRQHMRPLEVNEAHLEVAGFQCLASP